MEKPLVTIVEEVKTQLKEEGMLNAPTNVDMEKQLRVQKVVREKVIIGREDHKSQYLENEDVDITT
jgi:hypothetical protein